MKNLPPKGVSISVVVILVVVALVLGAAGGYSAGKGSSTALENQVKSLQDQVTSLQSQISTLQGQITTLTNEKTELLNDKAMLESQVTSLQQNITLLESELSALNANYSEGAVLTTFSGGSEDKTGPVFHIPAGNVKIVASLTSLGENRIFYIDLYKVGQDYPVWSGTTDKEGDYVNYVYSLEAGDYYLKVSSVNFDWKVTVYVYGKS